MRGQGGQELGMVGAPEGIMMTPPMQRALEAQERRQQAEEALIPNKGEQRRLASVQLAIQAGTDPADITKVATAIDKFISTGPNS